MIQWIHLLSENSMPPMPVTKPCVPGEGVSQIGLDEMRVTLREGPHHPIELRFPLKIIEEVMRTLHSTARSSRVWTSGDARLDARGVSRYDQQATGPQQKSAKAKENRREEREKGAKSDTPFRGGAH